MDFGLPVWRSSWPEYLITPSRMVITFTTQQALELHIKASCIINVPFCPLSF